MALAAFAIACAGYLGYACAALIRVGAYDHPVRLVAGLLVLAALWVGALKKPFAVTYLLLAILPLFGNHPGGRYMELINLPLAASAAGLVAAARRGGRPLPDGPIWRLAGLMVLSAMLSVIPTLPRLMLSAAQLDDPTLVVSQALTAVENDPLYSLSSATLVTLAAVWSFALCWAGATGRFARRAPQVLTLVFFGVMAVGISDYGGLTAIGSSYVHLVDARAVHFVGLQSIFWHPAWFAWYFVLVFPIALGLWWIEARPARLLIGVAIAVCYLFFFFNPQRAGLIAVHVVLLLMVWFVSTKSAGPRRSRRRLAAAVIVIVVATPGLLSVSAVRGLVERGHLLSLQRSVNNAVEFVGSRTTSERLKLWQAALSMWRDAPLFGVGEGSFAWRFHDYVPPGSALDTISYGDAHSTWFQALATRGIAGAGILVCLVAAVARALWARWRDPVSGAASLGLVLSLAGFLTYSFVNALFYLQPIQVLFWLIVAIAAEPASERVKTTPRFAIAVGCGGAVAAALLLAASRPAFADAFERLSREPRGFYPQEVGPPGRLVRWSAASGVLCLAPDAGRIGLRFAAVDPRVHMWPRTVTLRLEGREIDRFDLTTLDVTRRVLDLPHPSGRSGQAMLFGECTSSSRRLQISVSRTWNPADAGFNADARRLGVLVFEPDDLPAR